MKLSLRIVFLLCILVLAGKGVQAQHHVNVHAGASLPLGDFAKNDIDDEEASGASTGFHVGGQYIYQFNESGVGVFAGIDICYNELSKDYRDAIFAYYQNEGLYGTKQDFYEFISIPTTMGFHYYYKASDAFGLQFNGGMAFNILYLTNYEVEYQNTTITTTFNPSAAFGYKIGAGVIILEKFTLMADYLAFIKNEFEGDVDAPGLDPQKVEGEAKVSLLNLSVGYRF